MKIEETIEVGGKTLSISTGELAKQADGAVWMQLGETVVLVTACANRKPNEGVNFLPLTVDYREYTFAAGKIPGGFFKREGRPSENEILTCRLTDRALRPLFPDGYHNETQIVASTYSYDLENEPDVLTITGASTALMISSAPYNTPIAAVRIGMINNEFIVNPTHQQIEESDLNLMVASSEDAILMVEAAANLLSEEKMLEALELAFDSAQPIIAAQRKLAQTIGKEKWSVEPPEKDEKVYSFVEEKLAEEMPKALSIKAKQERADRLDELKEEIVNKYEEDSPERDHAKNAFSEFKKKAFRKGVFSNNLRFDGRQFNEVRAVSVEIDVLPRSHGSAVFTRGETQSLVSTTLGTKSDAQIMDELGGEWKKRFLLHYSFPPFSVGEVRFMRGPGRREIGHGNLALRSLEPVLPGEDEFPYTMRVYSEILESNGSSSMATVCGGSLSLMDAGVPLKAPVAGIAMGLMKEGDDFVVLSDIAGEEDHYGDMDFKVAGTSQGITALQMDIKIAGVTRDILSKALAQAKEGREFILGKMAEVISEPRSELNKYAPRIVTMKVNPDKIRDIIGKGGATIRGIIEATGAEIDVEDDGTVMIYSSDKETLDKTKAMINAIVEDPEVGKVYIGKVVNILDFGAIVEILPGSQGLLHISEIANYRVGQVTDEVNMGDELKVKVLEIDKRSGKIRLSRKAVIEGNDSNQSPRDGGDNGGGGRPNRGGNKRGGGGSRGSSGGGNRGGSGASRGSDGGNKGDSDNDGGGSGGGPKFRSRRKPVHGKGFND